MKKFFVLSSLFIWLQINNGAYAGAAIDFVHLEFTHSMRIPNHQVSVEIRNRAGDLVVHTSSTPRGRNTDFDHTKIDTLFSIPFDHFFKTLVLIDLLDTVAVQQNLDYDGLDGNTCVVSFGNAEKSRS